MMLHIQERYSQYGRKNHINDMNWAGLRCMLYCCQVLFSLVNCCIINNSVPPPSEPTSILYIYC